MSRDLKLLLWFLLGWLIAAVPMFALAAETCDATTCTIAATATPRTGTAYAWRSQSYGRYGSDPLAVCKSNVSNNCASPASCRLTANGTNWSCYNNGSYVDNIVANTTPVCTQGNTDPGSAVTCTGNVYTCPTGQNWTLSGSSCTRPACPLGRNADGTCNACTTMLLKSGACAEPCTAGAENTQFNKTTAIDTAKGYCGANNCAKSVVSRTPIATSCAFGAGGVGLCQTGFSVTLRTTGGYCDYEDGGTPGTVTPAPEKNDNPCPAGNGVVQSAGGFLRCLPQGASSSETPVKTTTTNTPSDGTQPTTTTNNTTNVTTCTTEGSCTTTTTVTTSGGTTVTTTEQAKGAFCAKNPKDDACTGVGTANGNGTVGNGNSSGCDPTTQMCGDPGTTGLYTKKEKTISDVVTAFSTGFKSSAVGTAMSGYFNVSVPSGACPAWTAHVDYLNTTINMGQYFCNSTADSVMTIIGGVLMVLAAFTGFKWAVL